MTTAANRIAGAPISWPGRLRHPAHPRPGRLAQPTDQSRPDRHVRRRTGCLAGQLGRVGAPDVVEVSGVQAQRDPGAVEHLLNLVRFLDHRADVRVQHGADTGVLDVLTRMGVKVPDDISVVGYDDSRLARLAHVNLTTIAQDTATMTKLAVARAIDRIERSPIAHREIVVPPRLVVRGTTAAAS